MDVEITSQEEIEQIIYNLLEQNASLRLEHAVMKARLSALQKKKSEYISPAALEALSKLRIR